MLPGVTRCRGLTRSGPCRLVFGVDQFGQRVRRGAAVPSRAVLVVSNQLVDDVVAMPPGRRVLEVGAGIATAAFAGCGMAMTCVEPDPKMAAVLSAKVRR
ncbi:hypothetical protein [Virgisporangium aurantiacum]|nr:hypothetical protein [Virgisporangium aurantiacum]